MNFRSALAGVLGALALFAGTAEPPVARAGGCDTITFGDRAFVFYKQGVRCDRAKRWLRHVRRTRGAWEPAGWNCGSGSGWRTGGNCWKRGDQSRLFGFHPFD